jgi:hypothetical protein
MKHNWATIGGWVAAIAICAVSALSIGAGGTAAGRSQESEWRPPETVENPFVVKRPPGEVEATSAGPPGDAVPPVVDDLTLPIEGEPADYDLPPIYRLPPVTPIDAPIEAPPEPRTPDVPMIDPELPRNDVALSGPDMPRLAERSLLTQSAAPADANLFSPNVSELSAQLLPAIQRGCDLAQRGALYAAQTEFIQVMRRIAQANDAERETDEHSLALAEGLRALDEAADFMPQGAAVEGEIDVKIIASSHRTPLVRQFSRYVPPHSAIALYHAFAHERLAAAMGGHQAGSMALFALGRVHARLAERNDDDVLATRSAMTMYLAALAVSPGNHLAANELGVLLCRNGHPVDAARLFEQAIDHAPAATTYHNLAVAQQKLGLAGPAAANEQESHRLAAWERATGAVSRRAGIQWVSPHELAQVTPPAGLPTAQNAPAPMPYAAAPIPPKSPLQKAASLAKSLPIPGTRTAEKTPAAPAPRGQAPGPAATTRNIPWF